MKHGRSWLSALLISFSILSFAQKEPVDYVNTIIGASTSAEAGKSGHGLGKTFPGSCTPFGLVQLSPDTKTGGDNGPGYSWHHSTIEGFSFTHLSGIGWYGDFGNFLVMPTTGPYGHSREPKINRRKVTVPDIPMIRRLHRPDTIRYTCKIIR